MFLSCLAKEILIFTFNLLTWKSSKYFLFTSTKEYFHFQLTDTKIWWISQKFVIQFLTRMLFFKFSHPSHVPHTLCTLRASYLMYPMYLIPLASHVLHTLCTPCTSYLIYHMYLIVYAPHVPVTLCTPCTCYTMYPMYLSPYVPHVPGTVVKRSKIRNSPPPSVKFFIGGTFLSL